jgi:hypothetical protein
MLSINLWAQEKIYVFLNLNMVLLLGLSGINLDMQVSLQYLYYLDQVRIR